MSDETAADRYARARMQGMGDVEAAEEAGYSNRAPGEARSLWHKVEVLAEDRGSLPDEQELEDGIMVMRARIGRLKQQMRSDLEWLRALRIVKG